MYKSLLPSGKVVRGWGRYTESTDQAAQDEYFTNGFTQGHTNNRR